MSLFSFKKSISNIDLKILTSHLEILVNFIIQNIRKILQKETNYIVVSFEMISAIIFCYNILNYNV